MNGKADGGPAMRERYDWMRLEIECLLCGRFLARATGRGQRNWSSRAATFWAQLASSDQGTVVSGADLTRMRCQTCGGPGVVATVDEFATYSDDGRPLFRKRPAPRPTPA